MKTRGNHLFSVNVADDIFFDTDRQQNETGVRPCSPLEAFSVTTLELRTVPLAHEFVSLSFHWPAKVHADVQHPPRAAADVH
jgi:hypothetical protein